MTFSTHPAVDPPINDALRERQAVLRRTLRALPDPLLDALAAGLEKHWDRLVAGRLFGSPKGGGCAVGVMLHELEPHRYGRSGVRFWLRDRWRRGSRSYHGALSKNPRLRHLEWTFDGMTREVRRASPDLSRKAAAVAAGELLRAGVEVERGWRRAQTALSPPGNPEHPRAEEPAAAPRPG